MSARKTKCVNCPLPAINKATRVCPYHWAAAMWGSVWANKCHPDHAAEVAKAQA